MLNDERYYHDKGRQSLYPKRRLSARWLRRFYLIEEQDIFWHDCQEGIDYLLPNGL